MNKALINIDYTNDFVASDGSLTVGEPAQKLEKRITEISQEFLDAVSSWFLRLIRII